MDKLVQMYISFTPREKSLQSLSMEIRRYKGLGNIIEFSVNTVYSAMTISVMEHIPEKYMHRTTSLIMTDA